MDAKELVDKLEAKFEEFKISSGEGRKEIYKSLSTLCGIVASQYYNGYLSEKCAGFLDSCKEMSKIRHSLEYDETRYISFAISDLRIIKRLLSNKSS